MRTAWTCGRTRKVRKGATWDSRSRKVTNANLKLALAAMLLSGGLPLSADYYDGQRAWDAKRYDEALSEWQASADGGDSKAMLALGTLYVQGLGAPQDYVLAHMWFNLAASRGENGAAQERDALSEKMAPSERAEAQKRAREWRPTEPPSVAIAVSDDTTKAAAPTPPPPARAVREAQSLLAALGYEPGPADGVWSDRTRRAHEKFLGDAGLAVVDVLTPDVLREMRRTAQRWAAEAAAAEAERTPPDTAPRAAAAGDLDGLQAALAAGADANARDANGWTALHHIADKGYVPMLDLLLQAQANPNLRAPDGATPLFVAAARDHFELIAKLAIAGASLSVPGPGNMSPADVLRRRYVDGETLSDQFTEMTDARRAVRALLDGATSLDLVTRYGTPDTLKLLIDGGADVNANGVHGMPPIFRAIDAGSPEKLLLLIESGADINSRDEDEYTPLLWSLERGNKQSGLWKLLIESGADVNVTNGFFYPIALAALQDDVEMATALLEAGADPNVRDGMRYAPLHRAVDNDNVEMATALLEAGADPNVRDGMRYAPLHRAVDNDNVEMATALLEAGADPNVGSDGMGYAPLHMSGDKPRMWNLLIQYGANVNLKDAFGHTPKLKP